MLKAREFNKRDKQEVLNMIKEIKDFDANFEGLYNLGKSDNYEEILQGLELNKSSNMLNRGYSPQTTFGVFDEDKLIGGFNLRHVLTAKLRKHGGNIGYLVRPSERKNGYGKEILKLALGEARKIGLDKVLITCRQENIASAKVIMANGGVYENSFYEEETGKTFKRFWIEL